MASEVKVSLTIESTDTAGKKTSTKIPYVNPKISNDTMKTFAEMCAALSTDTYKSTTKTTEEDITEGGGGGADGNYTIYYRGDALQATGDSIVGLFKVADSRANQLQGKYFDIKAINKDFNGGTNQGAKITVSGYKVKGMTFSGIGTNTITISFAADFALVDNDEEEIFDMQINVEATETYAATTLHYYIFTDPANVEVI